MIVGVGLTVKVAVGDPVGVGLGLIVGVDVLRGVTPVLHLPALPAL